MNTLLKTCTRLGAELRGAVNDERWHAVLRKAVAENPWFTSDEIFRAMRSIADEMLRAEKLEAWLARYPSLPLSHDAQRNVLIVMAGNIPLVGFFDLLCVLLAGHRALVKPSGKDRVLMEAVIGELLRIDPSAPVELYDTQHIDALIATGSDNAERYFKTHYAGTPSLLRGSRQSVAVLAGDETEEELRGLADDIWAYQGLGCRNVSLLFAPEGYEVRLRMPGMNPKYRNNYLQHSALLRMNDQPYTDLGSAVLVEGKDFPTALSEIRIRRYASLDEVLEWLSQNDRAIQCIVSHTVRHNRCVGFGRAQAPELWDYPDERDVMQWLAQVK